MNLVLIKNILQIFAEENTNTTASEGLSEGMKTYYNDTLIDLAEGELIHDKFGDAYDIPKNGGKSIEFRVYEALPKAMTPLVEGVTPDGNKLSMRTINAEIDQFGDYIVSSDVVELTHIDNVVLQKTKMLASQAGRTLDSITRNVLAGGTNVIYASKEDGTEVTSRASLDKTCLLTRRLVSKAATLLKKQHAQKFEGSYIAIIHPDVSEDFRNSDGWLDVHKYAATTEIFEGEIGKIDGVRFIENTEAKVWKDETCPEGLAVYSTLVLGQHAYATTKVTGGGLKHIVKQLGYGNDPLDQRSSVGWKAIKTAERLVEQYMVRIETCSSYSEVEDAN